MKLDSASFYCILVAPILLFSDMSVCHPTRPEELYTVDQSSALGNKKIIFLYIFLAGKSVLATPFAHLCLNSNSEFCCSIRAR
jgi:hypothetical protein